MNIAIFFKQLDLEANNASLVNGVETKVFLKEKSRKSMTVTICNTWALSRSLHAMRVFSGMYLPKLSQSLRSSSKGSPNFIQEQREQRSTKTLLNTNKETTEYRSRLMIVLCTTEVIRLPRTRPQLSNSQQRPSPLFLSSVFEHAKQFSI